MAPTRAVQTFKDGTPNLEARIINAIAKVGPRNIAEIARVTGVHQETIRYKVKRQFADLGFRFQAEADYAKLGLSLFWANIDFMPKYYSSASRFFRALNDVGYLIHYSKILPSGRFVSLFALPNGGSECLEETFAYLRNHKFVEDFSLSEVLVERHKPMDGTHFDFREGRWEVDWRRVEASPRLPLSVERRRAPEIMDEMDALVVKELQVNALQHTTEIAKKLKLNEKTLEYHYRSHVMKKGLIPRYRVRWLKDLTKTVGHSIMVAVITLEKPHSGSFKHVQQVLSRIPFLWVEYLLKDDTYIAILGVQPSEFMEMLGFLNAELGHLEAHLTTEFMKVGESFNYTIPYNMLRDGKWNLDSNEMRTAALSGFSNVEK